MNRYALNIIFAFTIFSLCCMEENSGGSAGKSQSIFSMDTLLATERPSWRQVTSADLQEIAQRLGVPDQVVRDASFNYKRTFRDFNAFRNANREKILSEAEMYRRVKMLTMKVGQAKREAWDAITEEDKKIKSEEVGVSFETIDKAFKHYKTNKIKPEVFWQADRQALEEAAGRYERSIQRKRQRERDERTAHTLLELQTSGEQP